jgi:hypothetical protein
LRHPSDVPHEMSKTDDMADRELERLLSGWRPAEDDSQGLARFFKDLDEANTLPSTDHCEAAHVSAMIEASRLPTSADSLAVRPVGNTTRPKPQTQGSKQTGRMTVRLPLLHKVVSMPIKLVAMIAAFMVVGGGVALAAGLTDGFTQAPGGDTTTTVTQPSGQPGEGGRQHGATTDVSTDETTAGSDETDCTDVDCTDVKCTDSNCPCVDCDNYSRALGTTSDDQDCTDPNCPCVECRDDATSDHGAVDQIDDDADVNDSDDADVNDSEDGAARPDTHTTQGHGLETASDTNPQD